MSTSSLRALVRLAMLELLLLASLLAAPEPTYGSQDVDGDVRALLEEEAVQRAFAYLERVDDRTVADQVALTEIAAPPFGEDRRAARFLARLEEVGVDDAWIDEEGNVIALRKGGSARSRVVAISAHLDTVFPQGTDVTVSLRGDTLLAPGISDDGRGLAALLAVLGAMNEGHIITDADLLFIGTVGEEGLGDLRGTKHLFRTGGPRIDAFISVDGSDPERITHMALGSHRYRVVFRGDGGHSWNGFGRVNPAHALGRAIHHLGAGAARLTRDAPRTTYNVGRISGGTSVNAIPQEAWMEVDLRSEAPERLLAIDSVFRDAVHQAVQETNEGRRVGGPLDAQIEMIGNRPSGAIQETDRMVLQAESATRLLGLHPVRTRASTDANVPISLGVPAITIGAGGISGRAHSLDEWFVNRDGPLGLQRVLLILLAQAGLASS